MEREVFCPTCKKKTKFSSENPFRPFCSERCRLIDLGDWASGNHRIPQSAGSNDEEDSASKSEQESQEDSE